MEIGKRIKEAREARGVSVKELAHAVELGVSTLYDLERGDQESTTKLGAIADYLDVRYQWLEKGVGPRDIDPEEVAAQRGLRGIDRFEFVDRVRGPHLSAGSGEVIWDYEEIDRSHAFQTDWIRAEGWNPRRLKLFEISGSSMDPTLKHGDTVMVNLAARDVSSGLVYALVTEDGLRAKRLHKRSGEIWMHSDNPDQLKYPPEPIRDQNAAVIGEIVWKAGKL